MTDPYVYPGTDVLKNKKNITDFNKLQTFERFMSRKRIREPLPAIPLTYEGYKALHRHIFQDVYEWAGQARTVSLSKGKTFFGPPDHVDTEMKKRFDLLAKENHLKGLSRQKFAQRAAEHINEINAIHPFREGNGRAQRLFLKELARQAGHTINLQRIKPGPWHEASVKGFAGNTVPMKTIILDATMEPARTQEASRQDRSQQLKTRLKQIIKSRSKDSHGRGR